MDVIVFGAAGRLGVQVLERAVAAGHSVTAFVRDPAKVQVAGVRVVQGDAFDANSVRAAIAGHDAVLSALGSTKGPDKNVSLQRMGANIAAGMRAEGVRRIVWCASEGIDGEIPGLVGSLVMKLLAKPLADHRAAIAEFDGLDLTIVRPRSLTNGDLAPYTEVRDSHADGGRSISRASVADFMVKALADDSYVGASVALTSKA